MLWNNLLALSLLELQDVILLLLTLGMVYLSMLLQVLLLLF